MQQIALDLHRVEAPTLENFVAGRNGEALACLRALRDGARADVPLVYLWGEPGCGRTHLALATSGAPRTLAADAPAAAFEALLADAGGREYRSADAAGSGERLAGDTGRADPAEPGRAGGRRIVAVLDVERLDAERQSLLFHLINRMRAQPAGALVITGAQPPLALPLREELRTRLGAGLVFRLRLLGDDEKAAALERVARERGVTIAPDVVPWLIAHTSRDIRALLRTFDALDRRAFERRRPITLPLLRDLLAEAATSLKVPASPEAPASLEAPASPAPDAGEDRPGRLPS